MVSDDADCDSTKFKALGYAFILKKRNLSVYEPQENPDEYYDKENLLKAY